MFKKLLFTCVAIAIILVLLSWSRAQPDKVLMNLDGEIPLGASQDETLARLADLGLTTTVFNSDAGKLTRVSGPDTGILFALFKTSRDEFMRGCDVENCSVALATGWEEVQLFFLQFDHRYSYVFRFTEGRLTRILDNNASWTYYLP